MSFEIHLEDFLPQATDHDIYIPHFLKNTSRLQNTWVEVNFNSIGPDIYMDTTAWKRKEHIESGHDHNKGKKREVFLYKWKFLRE